MEDLAYLSAQQAAQALARGEVSSSDLTEAVIARISLLDGLLNAVVVRDFERARAAARAADVSISKGLRLPLLGVPITVKESFRVAGLRTTWGVPAYRNWQPANESLAVKRLKRAGAIIVGKTNVSMGLADWQCSNPLFGRTNNPWDASRSPGGSSGGSAASLAAGFSFLELGSDAAGSIRIPAHFCGVFGHRPTYGLVPAEGYGSPGTVARSDLTTIGPMARTAADLMLGLEIISGPATPESLAYQLNLAPPRHKNIADFRCLILAEHPLVKSSQDVVRPLQRFGGDLRALGATVETSSSLLPDLADVARLAASLLVSMTLARVADEDFERVGQQAALLPAGDASLAATGLRAGMASHREWLRLHEQRCRLALVFRRLFQDWDVILCPVAPTVSYQHDDSPMETRRLMVDDESIPYYDQLVWSTIAMAGGLPATAAPFGLTEGGLPVGVQIIGPAFEDRTTIEFAARVEECFGGFTQPPGLAAAAAM